MRTMKHFSPHSIRSKGVSVATVMRPYFSFAQSFLMSPRQVGAICPSSSSLAMALVKASSLSRDEELVVDLGAGTGVVTEKLLKIGVPPESIIAVERSKTLVSALKRKYPGVLALQEDACNLDAILAQERPGKIVRTIISSLPFRSLPTSVSIAIAEKIKLVLQKQGGTLVQFSYAWWTRYPLRRFGFTPLKRHFVFKNIPPAIVEVYTVQR